MILVILGAAGIEADVVEIPRTHCETVAVGVTQAVPLTSQSPAVRLILMIFVGVAVLIEVVELDAVTNSPMLPALALLLVVVPTMPFVWEGVTAPVKIAPVVIAKLDPQANPVPLA